VSCGLYCGENAVEDLLIAQPTAFQQGIKVECSFFAISFRARFTSAGTAPEPTRCLFSSRRLLAAFHNLSARPIFA
jgi:hypothetical protein